MAFEEWYSKNIVCGQPWGENKDYQDNHVYKAMKRAWDTGYDKGYEDGWEDGSSLHSYKFDGRQTL